MNYQETDGNTYAHDINETYLRLFEQQEFVAEDLDYSLLKTHKIHLEKLADIGNSVISIFDAYEKKHAFYSSNVGSMLGYLTEEIEVGGEHFLDTKVHPDDFLMLLQNSISILKLYLNFSEDEKINHKLINEYRILNASGQYVRVIEQHQALELDRYGNLWLALSILDISPDQNIYEGIKSQVLNFRTGKFIPLFQTEEQITPALTQREIQILELVKEGFLSKEISDKLAISLHTVNTHRQRVLEKLGANNSIEAVILASKLGLI